MLNHSPDRRAPHIPGEPGIWVVVMGDLCLFALLFGTVAYYRLDDPVLFHIAQVRMNLTLGLVNTLALLTSSLFVVLGLEAARAGQASAGKWFAAAGGLGLLFVGIKCFEYAQKVSEGLLPDTNIFFTLYFVLTGIHLGHVVIGLIALFFMRKGVAGSVSAENLQLLECGAIFWHLVDVLWVFLFAIFYLHR